MPVQPDRTAVKRRRLLSRFPRIRVTQEAGVAASIIVLVAIFSYLQPLFGTASNFLTITRQASEPALLGMGQAFAMIAGGFDLSIGAITGLASAIVAYAVLAATPAGIRRIFESAPPR